MAEVIVDCMACLVALARGLPADPPSAGRIVAHDATYLTYLRVVDNGITWYDAREERIACTNRRREITWRTRWTSAVMMAMRSSTA